LGRSASPPAGAVQPRDAHHHPAAHLPGHQGVGLVDRAAQGDFLDQGFQLGRIEVTGQAVPGALAPRERRHHRIDAGQRHAAQDERHHRGGQIGALGQPAGGHHAAVAGLRQSIGQGVRAHRIDHAGPAFLLEGLAGGGQLGPVDDGGGAQGLQPVGLGGLAGGRDHGVAQAAQQRHGDAADPAGGAGHQNLASAGLHAVVFERQHTEHGGVAGRADGHRLPGRERRGQLDQPVALEAGLFCQAAPVRLAHAPAVVDEGIAGLPLPGGWIRAPHRRRRCRRPWAIGAPPGPCS
jgi:hypothetical protein